MHCRSAERQMYRHIEWRFRAVSNFELRAFVIALDIAQCNYIRFSAWPVPTGSFLPEKVSKEAFIP